jgi:hypothetical protein
LLIATRIQKEKFMKLAKIATTFLGGSLLIAMGAMAQDKATLNITEKVTVQGTELKPGKYEIAWDGAGPNVQLSIRHGKDNVVTVPATLIPRESPNKGNGYGARSQADGVKALASIYPDGKKYGVEIGQTQTAAGK